MTQLVRCTEDAGVVRVELADVVNKNTFSLALVRELLDVFARSCTSSSARVVVVHGYGNYFCCGGSKEELFELADGVRTQGHSGMSLDELMFFDLFMRCELPVIAAMQGHAIGGGLALGCFADLVILAEEAMYGAVFMKYGFTPGMGSTYIVPKRFGELLGAEMLYGANNYYGRDLKQRGAPVEVLKKAEVIPRALALAAELASKPRLSLRLLKARLRESARAELARAVEQERSMHRETFGQPEVLERIEQRFGA